MGQSAGTFTAAAFQEAVGRIVALVAQEYGIPLGAGEAKTATCTHEGVSWRVTLGERSAVVRESVGMLHLAVLLANPGVEVRAVELVAGVAGLDGAGRDPVAQPILDRTAVQRYRQRLTELTREIEDAEAGGHRARAARARREREWLVTQLGAGTGLGGRARHFPDGAENARIAVGKAIRRAIARVAQADRLVGDHLRRTVRTGVRCVYIVQ
ncbi:hypothetical protein [Actinoplanes sp. NPDC049316]|uniref:hypothetical protein n=1 Tax=Actinoplanes sp. NPDC049316 TaxID=3154727 RepID=UPI00341217E7